MYCLKLICIALVMIIMILTIDIIALMIIKDLPRKSKFEIWIISNCILLTVIILIILFLFENNFIKF